jgi:bacterioferritin
MLSQLFLYAQIVKGIDAETIMKKLEEQSMEGLKHAKILASRIIQLGGTPSIKPLETPASGFSSSPEDPTDLVHVIQVILKGESYQIDKYNKLAKKYHRKDLVTHEIFEDLLVNEVSDEEDWESFMPGLQQKQKQK